MLYEVITRYAINQFDFQRILIIDWDIHHGNGIQDLFFREKKVLYFSTHDMLLYRITSYNVCYTKLLRCHFAFGFRKIRFAKPETELSIKPDCWKVGVTDNQPEHFSYNFV